MKLLRVEAALEDCERHLEATSSTGTEIEAILTAYVSALIYAALEAQVRSIVAERVATAAGTDRDVGTFAAYASRRLVRSIKIGDLAGAAAWFHVDCKAQFRTELDDEAHTAWDTIISNRHDVAHETDGAAVSNLTFGELKDMYPKALKVLTSLQDAIAPDSPGRAPAE